MARVSSAFPSCEPSRSRAAAKRRMSWSGAFLMPPPPRSSELVVANCSNICHLAYAQICREADARSRPPPYNHVKTNDS